MANSLLLESPQDNGLRRRVAHYNNLVGASHYHLGEWAPAMEVRRQALTLWQEVAADDPSIENREGLALAYNRVAVMEARAGEFAEAERLQAQALEIYRDLTVQYSDNLPVQRGYATAHHYMGSFLMQANRLEDGRRHLETALEMRERVILNDPEDIRNRSFRALHQYELAECLRRLGEIPKALRHAEQSLDIRRNLAALDPGNAGAQAEVALALARVAVIRDAKGDRTGHQSALSESLSLFRTLNDKGQLNASSVEQMQQALVMAGALAGLP
jgi:tetratricopeptide (TPR) repeat protein